MGMAHHRESGPRPWQEWLWSALLGVGLALALIFWLGRARTPEREAWAPSAPQEEREQRSVGFEFTVRFRVLLPDRAEGE